MIARYLKVALLAFAWVPVTAVNSAETVAASACTNSEAKTVTGYSAKIRTVVKSESQNKAFTVIIRRNGEEVDRGTLNNDVSQVRYTMGVGNAGNNEVNIQVEIIGYESSAPPEDRTTTCNYNIKYDSSDGATWSLPDGYNNVCSNGIEVACDDCELECSKNHVLGSKFVTAKNRWTTTFTISD